MEFHLKIEKHYKADKDVHVEMSCKHAPAYSQLNFLLLNGSLRPTLMHEASKKSNDAFGSVKSSKGDISAQSP